MARAYTEVSTCRSIGMTLGPIPWTAIVKWAEVHGLDREVADHLVRVIQCIDAETLRRVAERAKMRAKPPRSPDR